MRHEIELRWSTGSITAHKAPLMHLFKPSCLGFSSRPIEYKKRFGLCISNLLHVPFEQGARGSLWGEQSLWTFLAEQMPAPLVDEGVAKLTSEFLVHGFAHPPPDRPNACAVRVRLGSVEKTLLAFGDRYWDGATATAPLPITQLPISWERAYGGADFPANLQGVGRVTMDGMRRLPNLELPQQRLTQPGSNAPPAGFAALDVMHPQRSQWRGTYDARYLEEHAPGFAPDLDWRHFNMAPRDQWFETPLAGDEPYTLDHLHPTQPHIEGRLPGLRTRTFVNYANGADHKLREVPMRLTTVWFFPHAERMVLVFHGLAESTEDDASDIEQVLCAVERVGETRDDAHYVQAMEERMDPVHGALAGLDDEALLPADLDVFDPAFEKASAPFRSDGLQADAQRRAADMDVTLAREQLIARGLDPDAMGVKLGPRAKKPLTAAQLPAWLKANHKEMERQKMAALEDAVDKLQLVFDKAEAGEIDLAQLAQRGPPRWRAKAQVEAFKRDAPGLVNAGNQVALLAKLTQKEDAERQGYLQAAHMQPPAYPLRGAAAANSRNEMRWMLKQGLRTLPDIDLTGADLSGLDLRNVDFSGAWMESTNLQGANLSGANLCGAVLAHADLRGLVAIGARLIGANLGRARLAGAVLDQSDLTGAVLMHCDLTDTHLRKSLMNGTNLFETKWGPADWTGVQAAGQLFYKIDLQGVVLAEADLCGCTFVECNLSQVDLRGAQLKLANFVGCTLDRARLAGACCDGAVFAKDSSLRGADLAKGSFRGANLGETDLAGARLASAVLDGANLGAARLVDCDIRLASLQGALLRKTVFKRSRLAGANLKEAILQRADLRSCDLRNANLFASDLSRVRLDGNVRFDGALLTRARTWPRLTAQQQAQADARDPLA
ncbi:MAG: DUF2169 domain-containing protein [Variovorax sp.]